MDGRTRKARLKGTHHRILLMVIQTETIFMGQRSALSRAPCIREFRDEATNQLSQPQQENSRAPCAFSRPALVRTVTEEQNEVVNQSESYSSDHQRRSRIPALAVVARSLAEAIYRVARRKHLDRTDLRARGGARWCPSHRYGHQPRPPIPNSGRLRIWPAP